MGKSGWNAREANENEQDEMRREDSTHKTTGNKNAGKTGTIDVPKVNDAEECDYDRDSHSDAGAALLVAAVAAA